MYQHVKKGKIVATLGPITESEEYINKLIYEGVNVFRLNFSHSTHEDHLKRLNAVRKVSRGRGVPCAILLDTKGPEIRVNRLKGKQLHFKVDDKTTINCKQEVLGTKECFSITHKNLYKDVMPGNKILFDDGQLEMKVISIDKSKGTIDVKVLNTYTLKEGKGVNCPGTPTSLKFISEKDKKDILFGCKHNVNYIAPSFVRKREDVVLLKKLILDYSGKSDIQIISKIECQEGVDNFDEILQESDGIMIARGDLGVEIPYESVPRYQKIFIKKCLEAGKPVIVATQMLKTMINNPYPTRAEVTDVYWAMNLGADAIMLSGETAVGKWPQQSVKVMYRVARRSENDLDFETLNAKQLEVLKNIGNPYYELANRIASRMRNDFYHCVVIIVEDVDIRLVKALSIIRTKYGVIPLVTDIRKAENLMLNWGIHPYVVKDIIEYYDLDKVKEVVKLRNYHPKDKVLYVIPNHQKGYSVRSIVF